MNWIASSDYLANTIIDQDPKADSQRVIIPGQVKCKLTLTVSSGEDLYVLDNYVGMNKRHVEIILMEKGINYKFEKVFDPAVEHGNIISTYPEPGTVVSKDTLIIFYESKGSGIAPIPVSNYVGLTSIELELALIKDDFKLGDVTFDYSENIERGRVMKQSIIEGTMEEPGVTYIDFVISLGPKPVDETPEDPEGGIVIPDNSEPDSDPDNDIFED